MILVKAVTSGTASSEKASGGTMLSGIIWSAMALSETVSCRAALDGMALGRTICV